MRSWIGSMAAFASVVMIARGEAAHERPACYEWSGHRGKRQPHWIHPPDGALFLFAGGGGRLVREWRLVVAGEDAKTCRITLTDDEQLQCEQLTRPRDGFVVRNDGSEAVDIWYRDEYFGRLAPGHRLSHMLIREGDRTAVIRLLDAAGNERVNVDLVAFTAEHRRGPIVVTSDGVTRECPSR